MPVEQISEPLLIDVLGRAEKAVSNGTLFLSMRIEPDPANGWPPIEELNAVLLEAFSAVGAVGWVGEIGKQYRSSSTFVPSPDPEPAPTEPAPTP